MNFHVRYTQFSNGSRQFEFQLKTRQRCAVYITVIGYVLFSIIFSKSKPRTIFSDGNTVNLTEMFERIVKGFVRTSGYSRRMAKIMGTISWSLHENGLETCQSVHLRKYCTCCDVDAMKCRDVSFILSIYIQFFRQRLKFIKLAPC